MIIRNIPQEHLNPNNLPTIKMGMKLMNNGEWSCHFTWDLIDYAILGTFNEAIHGGIAWAKENNLNIIWKEPV